MVCYPWVAQVFSGFTLKELKGYVDELMASGKPVPSTYFDGDQVKTIEVQPPRTFTGQQELYNKLMDNGIEVYVMTAASEELVRMVASDPKYGYNVKPQNVIGVSLLLKDRATGAVTTARKQISAGKYDPAANLGLELLADALAELEQLAEGDKGQHLAKVSLLPQALTRVDEAHAAVLAPVSYTHLRAHET